MRRPDYFPVTLIINNGVDARYAKARVIVADDVAWAWAEENGSVTMVQERVKLTEKPRSARAPITFETEDGAKWELRPGGGCRCSSPLQRVDVRGLVP